MPGKWGGQCRGSGRPVPGKWVAHPPPQPEQFLHATIIRPKACKPPSQWSQPAAESTCGTSENQADGASRGPGCLCWATDFQPFPANFLLLTHFCEVRSWRAARCRRRRAPHGLIELPFQPWQCSLIAFHPRSSYKQTSLIRPGELVRTLQESCADSLVRPITGEETVCARPPCNRCDI